MNLLIAITVLVDQVVKRICGNMLYYRVTQNFTLHTVWNNGVGFSLLSNLGSIWLALISLVITGYVVHMLREARRTGEKVGLALIAGGAIGNLIDRIVFGGVCDFIILHTAAHKFPAFNLADVAITIGATVWFLDSFWSKSKKSAKNTGIAGKAILKK